MNKTALQTLNAAGKIFKSVEGATKYLLSKGFNKDKAKRAATKYIAQHQPVPPDPVDINFLPPQNNAQIIWNDDCKLTDPFHLYGAFVGGRKDGGHNKFTNSLDQVASGRLAQYGSGGPNNQAWRQITVYPQDENWGVRDAFGYNWRLPEDAGWGIPGPGPTVLWHEGEYHLLTLWLKLGAINNTGYFRQLVETKQSEPYTENPSRGAMFELQQREGNWMFISEWADQWVIPVTQSVDEWVPISIEGFYSIDPNKGWFNFKLGNRESGIIHKKTLLRDTSNGQSIDSFMELGPYQAHELPQFSLGVSDIKVYG